MNIFQRLKSFSAVLALALCVLCATGAFAATPNVVIVGANFTAAGAQGGSLTSCTNATPIVCLWAAAHNLATGQQVRVYGVATNTNANGLWYVSVVDSTHASLYSDINLSVASVGNGAGTGGTGNAAYDVSALTGDWTLHFRLDALTSTKNVLISVQESEDGFNSDIRTLWVQSFVGPTTSGPAINQTLRKYQIPMNRFGASGTYGDAVRIYVQAIDGSATATASFFVEY